MVVSRSVIAESFSYRKRLVNKLVEEKVYSSHAFQEAFLTVPREAFLTGFYRKKGSGFSWEWMSAPDMEGVEKESWQEWYEAIYQDVALTTQVDANGRPTSSSSQPSVMAMMLDALDIQVGMRVLEIGTGTGYNAALMATLVGTNHLVTTIEIDEVIAVQAQQQLDAVMGPGIEVIVRDGLQFAAENAYDRIIVTGSHSSIPACWIRALAPRGVLLMDLRGDITGGLLRIQKEMDGTASGFFLQKRNAVFMPLRPNKAPVTRPSIETDRPVIESALVSFEEFSPEVLGHTDAGLWLQCLFPLLRVRRQYPIGSEIPIIYLIDLEHRTTVVMSPSDSGTHIIVHGTYPLWTQVYNAYQRWLAEGRPKREHYRVHVDPQGNIMLTSEKERTAGELL
jgi:protein-L-isoaspartate(D-aspartate) O-methyltransferase